MADTQTSVGPRESFLVAGFHELQRRYSRFNLRRTMARQAAARSAALAALGQRAWDDRIDLGAFADLRDKLSGLDSRAGEISQQTGQLDGTRASLEQERKAALETFGGRRQGVLDKKNPADAALRDSRSRRTACERTITQAEGRLAKIPGELAQIDREIAADAADPAKLQAAQERRARLVAEQGERTPALATARAEQPALVAEESRLAAESQEYAGQIAAIDAEQKTELARIDGELTRVRSALREAGQQASSVQKDKVEHVRALGAGLYDARTSEPALAEAVAAVAAIDRERADAASALECSQAATQALAPGVMVKFWGVVSAVVLVVVGIAYGAASYENVGVEPLHREAAAVPAPARTLPERERPVVDPDAGKAELVQRFVQAGSASDPKLRTDAVAVLKDDIETMGATANPGYLPILAKVLGSDEPELRLAAVDAMGMIGPTDAETPAITRLLNDPVPDVAAAARRALAGRPAGAR